MSKKIHTSFSPNIEAPLLDKLLQGNKERSKAEGIDIDAMSEAHPYAASLRKENHKWEDLNDLDQFITEGIVNKSDEISKAYSGIVQNNIEHTEELRLSVETYMDDMSKATDDLLTIRTAYADRSGLIDPRKDVSIFTAITTDYLALKDRIGQLTLPVVLNLSEAQIDIEAAMRAKARNESAAAQEELQDKNVVSDVTFTEGV